jgi:hypothetical protein
MCTFWKKHDLKTSCGLAVTSNVRDYDEMCTYNGKIVHIL